MTLKERLNTAVGDAMKSGDAATRTTLRMALAAVRNAEIDARADLDDAGVIAILQKEVKARREAMADAQAAQRADLLEAAQAEIAILERFLPTQLSEEALRALVQEAIAETGAVTVRDTGNVMKALMPRVAGQADGKMVGNLVREYLQG
jgi:uncharacterized protein YqeY